MIQLFQDIKMRLQIRPPKMLKILQKINYVTYVKCCDNLLIPKGDRGIFRSRLQTQQTIPEWAQLDRPWQYLRPGRSEDF